MDKSGLTKLRVKQMTKWEWIAGVSNCLLGFGTLLLALRAIAVLLLVLWTQACTYVKIEGEHISHPMAGWPVSDKSTEDAISQFNACLGKSGKIWFTEQCLGYKISNQGFYGPEVTYTGRAGVKFNLTRE